MAKKRDINRTELVWAGKYDENGELKPVERTILPFQVAETVKGSKADGEKARSSKQRPPTPMKSAANTNCWSRWWTSLATIR